MILVLGQKLIVELSEVTTLLMLRLVCSMEHSTARFSSDSHRPSRARIVPVQLMAPVEPPREGFPGIATTLS